MTLMQARQQNQQYKAQEAAYKAQEIAAEQNARITEKKGEQIADKYVSRVSEAGLTSLQVLAMPICRIP